MTQFIDDHKDEFAGRAGLQAPADRPADLLRVEEQGAVGTIDHRRCPHDEYSRDPYVELRRLRSTTRPPRRLVLPRGSAVGLINSDVARGLATCGGLGAGFSERLNPCHDPSLSSSEEAPAPTARERDAVKVQKSLKLITCHNIRYQ